MVTQPCSYTILFRERLVIKSTIRLFSRHSLFNHVSRYAIHSVIGRNRILKALKTDAE